MKNTNLNQFMMLLMLSVTSAGAIARPAMVADESRYGTLPIGLETDYKIEEVDNGPRYIITEQDTPHYREEAAPVDFTVETPSVMRVGENPEAPLMDQMKVVMDKLKNMKREEDAKDLSEVVFRLEMANHKIQSLPILEGNKKAYDREVLIAEKEVRQAEHEYRKATHGSKRN